MAVYEGARRRASLPLGLDALNPNRERGAHRDAAPAPSRARPTAARATHAAGSRRTAAAGRRRTRPSSIGVALAAIVIVFSAAFLSLSQSVRVAATGYADLDLRIRTEDGLALLFTPPFDNALPDPGYIKGYPPGLRENGGQYTHAALWSVMALATVRVVNRTTPTRCR